MARTLLASVILAGGLMVVGCESRPASNADPTAAESAEKKAAEDRAAAQRKRSEEANELERRAANLESQWTEMQTKVKTQAKAATATLRKEVAEDVKNARTAVADLKTTTEDNWWDRHARALEQSVADVRADVQRLTRQKVAPEPAVQTPPAATTADFTSQRDAFVNRLRAQVDAMEEQLEGVKARGTMETELDDTRARIDKLQDDLDGLRSVSADAWWNISSERVSEYIDRVEASIKRLDDNDARADTPRR